MSGRHDAAKWFPTLGEAKAAALEGAEIEVREVYINGKNGSSLRTTRYYVRAEGLHVISPD